MADFVDNEKAEDSMLELIDASKPLHVIYCGVCSMPPEFCEFGTCYDQCLPWILTNCPEVIGDAEAVSNAMNKLSVGDAATGSSSTSAGPEGEGAAPAADSAEGDEEKKNKPRGGGAAAPKKSKTVETRIVVTRVQRQKRKYVTVIAGIETIPDLKIKDAAKLFGKKFASGATVNEDARGQKEVVIQGDVMLEVPNVLIAEYKVAPTSIYFLEDGAIRSFA